MQWNDCGNCIQMAIMSVKVLIWVFKMAECCILRVEWERGTVRKANEVKKREREREYFWWPRNRTYIYCCECVWAVSVALPSLPSLFISFLRALHLSMQWQQICQNICGCYGDGYKELTWSWLLRGEIERTKRRRDREENEKIVKPLKKGMEVRGERKVPVYLVTKIT